MDSRYDDWPKHWAPHPSGRQVECVMRRFVWWNAQPYVTKRAVVDETFPLIAEAEYGAAELWWLVADLNPHVTMPDDLKPGDTVHLPVIEAR